MPDNDPILRIEYEARNAQTMAEIGRLNAKFDTLTSKFDALTINVNTQMGNIRTGAWKYIATSLMSFLLGGGALGLIEFLLLRK